MKASPESENAVSWFLMFLLEGVIIIFANVFSLCIFIRKFRHQRTYFFLINLSLADVLTGYCAVANGLIYIIVETQKNCTMTWNTYRIGFSLMAILESAQTLALVALERAYAIIKPVHHRVLSKKYYKSATLATWIVSCFLAITNIFLCTNDATFIIVFCISVSIVSICLIAIFVSYAAIYVKIRFFPIFHHNASTQVQLKLCKTLFIATSASILATVPIAGLQLYYDSCGGSCQENPYLRNTALFLIFSNSFVNLVIYAWKMPEFRKEIIKNLCCLCHRNNTRNLTAVCDGRKALPPRSNYKVRDSSERDKCVSSIPIQASAFTIFELDDTT